MPDPVITLADCWAKTDPATGRPALTVRDHCVIVGAVAEELWAQFPTALRSVLPPSSVALAALHDVGKLTFGFQAKCDSWKAWARGVPLKVNQLQNSCGRHAAVSQSFAELVPGIGKSWAKALGGHHGRFDCGTGREHSGSARLFEPLRRALADELSGIFGGYRSEPPPGDSELAEFPHVATLCGFIILCDWLGSDEENFPLPAAGLASPPLSREAARAGAHAALERRQIVQPALRGDRSFGSLFTPSGEPHYRPNALQDACAANIDGPGLYLVEAPMGMGKTEAALEAAVRLISSHRASGLYFALPTQLTSNKIYDRVAAMLANALPDGSPATLALAHSASWLADSSRFRIVPASPAGSGDDELDPRVARSWFTSRRALLARYGVGTIDQALMGALPVKYAALRLFGLAGKVVVFDEVHTYDAYTGRLLDRLIEHLLALRCTVIVLSATLTVARRAELLRRAAREIPPLPSGYPMLTWCKPAGTVGWKDIPYPPELPSHEVVIRQIGLATPALPEPIVEEIQNRALGGECVLVIRNTVALAQQTFAALRREGIETGLLHSRFPFHVRNGHPDPACRESGYPNGREAAWIDMLGKKGPRPGGCILVATQVAEQSLDIDADLLITDLCPADMLLQRIGRLWRHMTLRPAAARPCQKPETWVLVPMLPHEGTDDDLDRALKPHSAVYAPYVLLRTLRELPRELRIPGQIRGLLEAVYAAPASSVGADMPSVAPPEPAAWTALRHRFEKGIDHLAGEAGLLAANPYFPPTDDAEFRAPTRYRDFATIDLVALDDPPRSLPGGTIELRFHSGETMVWRPGQPWTFAIARAAFLSTVRVPAYLVPTEPPADWLALHTHGPVLAGFLRDGCLFSLDRAIPLPFRYEPDRGLVHEKMLATPHPNCSDEANAFDDESWF